MVDLTGSLGPSLVRIRASDPHTGVPGRVVGAGFLADDETICTCAHVVAIALNLKAEPETPPAHEVSLDFPYLPYGEGNPARARVAAWEPTRPDGSGDIAVLRLLTPCPDGGQPARLLSADDLSGRNFEAYGFPAGYDTGIFSHGVLGRRRADGTIQIEGTSVTGIRVQRGFSGAPVWDPEARGVVGIVVAADAAGDDSTRVAFMTPIALLIRAYPQLSSSIAGKVGARSRSSLQIDDVFVEQKSQHVSLDVRLRSEGSGAINVTRADLHILARMPYAGMYHPSAEYDIEVSGEHNVIALAQYLQPESVDRIIIRVGFTDHNTSCGFQAELILYYNGGMSVTSTPFSFQSVFSDTGYSHAPVPDCDTSLPQNNEITDLWVWSVVDTDIYVDGAFAMRINHESGLNNAHQMLPLKLSSTISFQSIGFEISKRVYDLKIPLGAKTEIHVGTESWHTVMITHEQMMRSIGSKDDIPQLSEKLLKGAPYSVRAWAAERLGYIADRGAIPALVDALDDTEPYVGALAAYALGQIGDTSVISQLKSAYEKFERKQSFGHMFEAAIRKLEGAS